MSPRNERNITRENAAKADGLKSQEGRANSSRNGLRTSLTAKAIVLMNESHFPCNNPLRSLYTHVVENDFVEQIATSQRSRRLQQTASIVQETDQLDSGFAARFTFFHQPTPASITIDDPEKVLPLFALEGYPAPARQCGLLKSRSGEPNARNVPNDSERVLMARTNFPSRSPRNQNYETTQRLRKGNWSSPEKFAERPARKPNFSVPEPATRKLRNDPNSAESMFGIRREAHTAAAAATTPQLRKHKLRNDPNAPETVLGTMQQIRPTPTTHSKLQPSKQKLRNDPNTQETLLGTARQIRPAPAVPTTPRLPKQKLRNDPNFPKTPPELIRQTASQPENSGELHTLFPTTPVIPRLWMIRLPLLLVIASAAVLAQAPKALESAYAALQAQSYEAAIELFHQAITAEPDRAAIRKDLAYTYLKIGEPESARAQFGEAMRIDPSDTHVALEYAFLCNETGHQAEARRIFDRIRKTGNSTAEQAFQNIDRPLADGIARWSRALELSPANFSAHHDLAQLAEQRDDLQLAAEHFEKAFQLKPDFRSLLIDLARIWKAQGRLEDATAAQLAASRSDEPRVAETARELLPARYPYVYEFQRALVIDSKNIELRRELGYLHLAMGNRAAAIVEFQKITELAPDDALSAAQLGFLLVSRNNLAARPGSAVEPEQSSDAARLGTRSLEAGYLKDALKYLQIAHENNPGDYSLMLKLGWTYNILRDDKTAMQWFQLARESPDPKIAAEAARAFDNLRPSQARFRTTVWTFPFFSSRWKDVFSYSQVKTEIKLGSLPLRPYISLRIVGDTRSAAPQFLSESSFIFALGLATAQWKGLMAWGEAGEAVRYRKQPNIGLMIPDYRGGISFARAVGHILGAESKGLFFETLNDGVFISRFQNDMLLYSQNHIGYTFKNVQLYWNGNFTKDKNRQYWANYTEQGPGLKFRIKQMPPSLAFSINALQGRYTINEGNPRAPTFTDLRVGLWYAFTH